MHSQWIWICWNRRSSIIAYNIYKVSSSVDNNKTSKIISAIQWRKGKNAYVSTPICVRMLWFDLLVDELNAMHTRATCIKRRKVVATFEKCKTVLNSWNWTLNECAYVCMSPKINGQQKEKTWMNVNERKKNHMHAHAPKVNTAALRKVIKGFIFNSLITNQT